MKAIQVTIEPGRDGYGVTFKTEGLEGVTSFGDTLDKAKANAVEALEEYVEFCKEEGIELPEALNEFNAREPRIRYSYMLKYYFKEFAYLNISKLARAIGLNPSLLRQYDKGLAQASESKYLEIREGLRRVGNELIRVV